MNWELHIKRVENGFLIIYPGRIDLDGTVIPEGCEVIEDALVSDDTRIEIRDGDADAIEKVSLSKLLFRIADFHGVTDGSYGNKNLLISWKREGRKYEPEGDL
jgi:hypothetical protein